MTNYDLRQVRKDYWAIFKEQQHAPLGVQLRHPGGRLRHWKTRNGAIAWADRNLQNFSLNVPAVKEF